LNNGFRRSVKTLSGGQAFQASLCLALALAENIQSMNKADKNFFFIDEGFGTQHPDSMNTVFETLQYLHADSRIGGISSHVEELKERIPRATTVANDNEEGSQLRYNRFDMFFFSSKKNQKNRRFNFFEERCITQKEFLHTSKIRMRP